MTSAKYIVKVNEDGDVFWYDYNNPSKIHRLDGLPACEYVNGDKYYYENGKLHRLDGPAVEYANGYKEYWIEGIKYSYEEWLEKVNPTKKEMTIVEIESALGYSIKIVK